MRRTIVLMACCILAIGASLSVFASDETVMVVSYAGDIKVIPFGETDAAVCKPGMILGEGTRLVTGEESYIEIAFGRAKNKIMKVRANSEVVIKLEGEDRVVLIDGQIATFLKEMKRDEVFRVRTPCAVAGARGTGWISKTSKKITDILVFNGKVFVRGINEDGSVMEGEDWVEEGFERKINRFERPGKMKAASKEKILGAKRDFGIENITGQSGEAKKEMIDKMNMKVGEKIEQKIDDIQEKRDEDRLDKINDEDKTEGGQYD